MSQVERAKDRKVGENPVEERGDDRQVEWQQNRRTLLYGFKSAENEQVFDIFRCEPVLFEKGMNPSRFFKQLNNRTP